uniref:AidA/PixA family protein n=1 Tax=Photorhabdus sp. RM322S TaxID=3342825 RepID=UPI0036DE0851
MKNIYNAENFIALKDNSDQSINIIDVLIAVDVELIIQDIQTSGLSFSQDYKEPTISDGRYLYYITSQQQIYNNNGQYNKNIDKLKITGNIHDKVIWRALSLSAQSEYQVFLYDMKEITGDNNIYLSENIIKNSPNIPIPQENRGIPSITYQKEHISYQEWILLNSGFSYCTLYLAIYNRSKLIGYYSHGPSNKESLQSIKGLPLDVTVNKSNA